MLYFGRIDVSEGIDANKSSTSKIKRCHDLLMMSMNLSDIAFLNINCSDHCCIISLISKNETINLM